MIARADQGRLPIKREQVEVRELLERVAARFATRAAETGRGDHASMRSPACVAGLDPLRIEQALGNLVDNALRHGAGEIRLRGALERRRASSIEVADAGGGFPAGFEELGVRALHPGRRGRTGDRRRPRARDRERDRGAHGGDVEVVRGDAPATVRVELPEPAATP